MNYNWQSSPYGTGPPGYGGFWPGGNWQQPPPSEMPSHNAGSGPINPQFSAEFYAPDPRLVRAPLPPPPPPPLQPMNFNPPPPQHMNFNYGNGPPPQQNMHFNQGNAPPPPQQKNFSHGNAPPQHETFSHGNVPPPPQHMNFNQGNAAPGPQHTNFNQGNAPPPPPQHTNYSHGSAPAPPSVPPEIATQGPQPPFRRNQPFESENRGRGAREGRGGRGGHAESSNNSPRQQYGGRGRDLGPPGSKETFYPNVEQHLNYREEELRPSSHGSDLIEEHGPYFWRNKNSPPANQRTPVKSEPHPDFPNKAPEVPQGRPNFPNTRGQGRYFDTQIRDSSPAFNRSNLVREFEAQQRVPEPPIEERKFIPWDSTQDFSPVNTSMETNSLDTNCRFPGNRESEMQDLHGTSRDGQLGTSDHQFPDPRPGPGPKKKKKRGKKGRGGLNSRTPPSFEKVMTPQSTLSRNQSRSSDLQPVGIPGRATNVSDVREINLSNSAVPVSTTSVQDGSAQKNREDFADDYFPSNFESGASAPPARPVSMIPGLDAPQTQEKRPDLEAEKIRSLVEASKSLLDSMPDINAVRRILQTLDSEDEDSFPEASSSNSSRPNASGQKTSVSLHSSKNSTKGIKSHPPGPGVSQRSHVDPSQVDYLPKPPPPPTLPEIRNALEASNLRLSDLRPFLAQEGNSDRPLFPNQATRQLHRPNSHSRRSPSERFSEFCGDVDLRKTLLPIPRPGNDNLSGPFCDSGHLSNVVESLVEGGGVCQTGSDLRLANERLNFGARDCDMRDPRLLDTFSSRMDVDHREIFFDRRTVREEEFLERDLDSRLSPVSPPLGELIEEISYRSKKSWEDDSLVDRISLSPSTLTPRFERDIPERWEEPPLERITSPEEGIEHLPPTRSRSPVLRDTVVRRSPSPFRHGRREGSPLSPRRRHSRRYSRSRSRDRSPRRVRSRYSRSPLGSDRHRDSRRRRSSQSPRRFHRRSRSPPVNRTLESKSRSRSPGSFRLHNSRHRSRTPPLYNRRISPRAGSRGYRSRSPSLRRERTSEPAYQSSSFVDEPPRNLPFYEHGLPPRDLPLTHTEPQFRELQMTNIQYSVPPPVVLPVVESVPNTNISYSVPPPIVPPLLTAVGSVPVLPNGNEVRSIPIVSKTVQSSKPAVEGRPNLCVINTSNERELVEPVAVEKPVVASEVNAEEELKKQQQELKEKKKARAQSRRKEFAVKHEKLVRELLRLKNQNAELTIKQMKIYGEREVERLSLLIVENAKLQNAVTKQIKTIGGVVKRLDLLLQSKEPMSLTAKKNFKFFDPQNHWCEICKEFFGDLLRYLEHCHSAAHKKQAANQKPVDTNEKLPWCSDTTAEDSQVPETGGAPRQLVPFDGVQFLVPVEAMYCKLCKEFMGDNHCALRHIHTPKHHEAYLEYIRNNPDWECTWIEARQTAFKEFTAEQKAKADLKAKEEAELKKLLDERRAKEYETFIKREESQRGNVEELDDSDQRTTTTEGQKTSEIRVNVNLKD